MAVPTLKLSDYYVEKWASLQIQGLTPDGQAGFRAALNGAVSEALGDSQRYYEDRLERLRLSLA